LDDAPAQIGNDLDVDGPIAKAQAVPSFVRPVPRWRGVNHDESKQKGGEGLERQFHGQ
jgi:hypothetical protein